MQIYCGLGRFLAGDKKVNPQAQIAFTGSTEERTKLYTRILKSYHSSFSKEFTISGFVNDGEGYKMIPFDPSVELGYVVFLVKRIVEF